jgi:PhnB protein
VPATGSAKQLIMQLEPYIIFDGRCEEALNFYVTALGGEIRSLMRYESAPVEGVTAEGNKVMHAVFAAGAVVFMASDSGSTTGETGNAGGGMVHLSLDFPTAEDLERVFAALSENASVTMPVQDTFWGARFGMLTDQFGVKWMFNHDKGQQGADS